MTENIENSEDRPLVPLGRYWNNSIALAIGASQFLLVFLYFMHVKYYRYPLIRYFALSGLFWVGMLFVLGDYLTRNHPADATPRGEPVFIKTP